MSDTNKGVAAIFYKAADALLFMDDVLALPSCNNCGKRMDCEHAPQPGQCVRINCFLWEGDGRACMKN